MQSRPFLPSLCAAIKMPSRKPSAPVVVKRNRATGRVTLADVAQHAGVSPITVSRALRGERAVGPTWWSGCAKPPTPWVMCQTRRRVRWLPAAARMWRC